MSKRPPHFSSGRLVADGWCWFVLREEYCWLVAGGWFVVKEKYCWLVADKPSEQGVFLRIAWWVVSSTFVSSVFHVDGCSAWKAT
jgi:hypothetical protein